MKQFQSMGVINVTPDSFSDGNKFNQTKTFQAQMLKAIADFDIIDIGAESTAPMNSQVPIDEEIKRLETTFIPFLKQHAQPNVELSFDTYKIEVFEWLYTQTRKFWGEIPIIFNDISGSLDDELINLSKRCRFSYVFCHNLAPTRASSSEHMKYAQDTSNEIFLERFESYFEQGLHVLDALNQSKVWIDPCFGFSKTRAQNLVLLQKGCEILNKFSSPVVYGVSRKSFLRNEDIKKNEYGEKVLDVVQSYLLDSFLKRDNKQPIFRIHDKASLDGLKIANEVLNCHN